MKLPIALDIKMKSYQFLSFPEMVLRLNPNLLPWIYENFINIYSDVRGHLNYAGIPFSYHFAAAQPFDATVIRTNLCSQIDFAIDEWCKQQVLKAGNYIYVFLDESYLSDMPAYGGSPYIHDSLVYGYDEQTDEFIALARVNLKMQEVRYSCHDFVRAYESSGIHLDTGRVQMVVFNLSKYLNRIYPFSMKKFLEQLSNYIDGIQDERINYFCGIDSQNIVYGITANEYSLAQMGKFSDELTFIEYRNVFFMAEHRSGLLERFEYILCNCFLSSKCTELIENFKMLVAEYEKLRLLALKYYISQKKDAHVYLRNFLLPLFIKEHEILFDLYGELRKGRKKECPFIYTREQEYYLCINDQRLTSNECSNDVVKLDMEFKQAAEIDTVRLEARRSIQIYNGDTLIASSISVKDSDTECVTIHFERIRTDQLTFVISSDKSIDVNTFNVEVGNIDLALGKKVTSINEWIDVNSPHLYSSDNITVDDTTLFWTAEANCNHGEIIVDLEEIHDISFICIIERLDCSRINNYSLYISEDGLEWHPIVEKKLGLWYGQPQVFEFAPRNTRYIKISIHDTIAGNDGCREPGLARVMAFKQPENM